MLMGATVPLLVGHLVRRCGHVGSAAGLLYCVNTLGVGVACLAGIVFLFPFVGMQGSVYAAAAINAAVASAALVAYWRARPDICRRRGASGVRRASPCWGSFRCCRFPPQAVS
jgi:predicted membrane-bound spermidine synthase